MAGPEKTHILLSELWFCWWVAVLINHHHTDSSFPLLPSFCLQSLPLVALLCLYNNIIESCFPHLLLPGSPDSSQNLQLGIVFKNLSAWKMSHSTGSRIIKPWLSKDLSNFSLRSLFPSIIQVPTCPLCDHHGTKGSWKALVSWTVREGALWPGQAAPISMPKQNVSVFSHSFILTRARKYY